MEKKMKSSAVSERQNATAKVLDEMVHSQLSRSSMGLSPISLAMASAEWAMHMVASRLTEFEAKAVADYLSQMP